MENKKKEKTKIDIILPNYNSSQFINKTIQSILKQSYKKNEIQSNCLMQELEVINILKKKTEF